MVVKKRRIKRKVAKRKIAKYIVSATFKMRSPHITKSQADKIAISARSKGGSVTIRKTK